MTTDSIQTDALYNNDYNGHIEKEYRIDFSKHADEEDGLIGVDETDLNLYVNARDAFGKRDFAEFVKSLQKINLNPYYEDQRKGCLQAFTLLSQLAKESSSI